MLSHRNAETLRLHNEQGSAALFQVMVDNATEGIVAINHRGLVVQINPAAGRLFGYQTDEVSGRRIVTLIPDTAQLNYQHYFDTNIDPDACLDREVEGRHKDGSPFPVHLSIVKAKTTKGTFFIATVCDLSKRKQIEAALQESEARFRQVAAMAREWIWEQDPSGYYIYSSSSVKDILGYEPSAILGKHYMALFTRDEREKMAADFPDASDIKAGFLRRINHYRDKTGHVVITESTGEPILDTKGKLIKWRGVDRDITARVHFENALRQSEEKLRLTLDNAPIGIATADLEGRLLQVNPAFRATLGYSSEELLQMSLKDLAHPEDRETILAQCRKLIRGEISTCEFEKRCIRKDGAVIAIRAHAGLVRDADSKPLLMVMEFEDITERKRAAEELKRMRAYLKNIVDSMPSILVGVDPEGRVTEWNTAAERATGVSTPKAIGQPFVALFPKLESQLEQVREAIQRRSPVHTERLTSEKDGKTCYEDVMVYPLLANGATGAVIRVDDVTHRVRIEQMMVQTEKMMSVGGVAAGMAHEINNPLSGVLQNCQNIQRRLSSELVANRQAAASLGVELEQVNRYLATRGILRFVDAIQEAATRASQIVADMLSFSRRSTTEFEPVRIDDLLDTVVRLASSDYDLKKKYDFKQIEILRDYDHTLGPVKCDRTEIEQVFLNLIKNAAQAMTGEGRPPPHQIILRTRRDGEYARIEVQDNGPGMDEKTRRRAFEPFFTTKPAGVGTGLGLSVSYFIITEQHNGTLFLSSAPGKGAKLVVRLPLQGKPS